MATLTTLRGTAAFGTGKFGNARTGGVLSTTTNFNSTVGTVEAWINTTSTGVHVAVGNSGTLNNISGTGIWIGINSGAAMSGLPNAAGPSGGTSLNNGAWHHLALTLDGSNAKLWVDGTLAATTASTATFNFGNGVAGVTGVGGYGADTAYDWVGGIDEVRISNTVRYTTAFTAPTAAFTTDANTLGLWHLEADGTDSAAAVPPTFAPNDAGIIYSPYNWNVTTSTASAINAGAYFRTTINGATGITLNFDLTAVTSPVPRIKARLDGSPWTTYDIAATIPLTMPTDNQWGPHSLEVVVVATSEFVTRWTPQNAIVKFTGISATGTSMSTRTAYPLTKNVLIYGDSITEGYKSVKTTTTPDGSDATVAWSYLQRHLLGVEVGVVGFGGQGWTVTGQGGVPALPSTYNLLWAGTARTFTTPVPDLIVINMGENDGTTDVTATVTTFLNTLLALNSTTKIAVVQPFSGKAATYLQAAQAACSAPSRITYVDTSGWFSASDAFDGVHPAGYTSINTLGPRLANALRPILGGASVTPKRFVNVGGTAKPIG